MGYKNDFIKLLVVKNVLENIEIIAGKCMNQSRDKRVNISYFNIFQQLTLCIIALHISNIPKNECYLYFELQKTIVFIGAKAAFVYFAYRIHIRLSY